MKVIIGLFIICIGTSSWGLDFTLDEFRVHSKAEMSKYMKSQSVNLEEWITQINNEPVDFLCLGESHTNKYREFYTKLIPRLNMDHLFLEAQQQEAQDLVSRSLNTSDDVMYESALISDLLRAVFKVYPQLDFSGVEPSVEQKLVELNEQLEKGSIDQDLGRESFIAFNVLTEMKKNQRHIALYGASHCSKYDDSLPYSKPFFRLVDERKEITAKSVYVVFSSATSEFTQAFRRSLIGLRMNDESFVLPDTTKIDLEKINYRNGIAEMIKRYDVIIYVKDN